MTPTPPERTTEDRIRRRRPDIPARERLILALDVPGRREAQELVETLGDSVSFFKLGLELFMARGYFELVDWLLARGKKVFVDLKFFDIPKTVESAVRQLSRCGVSFATVHGNENMLRAACRAKGDVRILAVTVLTSLDRSDLDDLGFETDVETLVVSRARRALEAGCDGVIASGQEAEAIRRSVGDGLLVVMPGIRPVWNDEVAGDDQKRVVGVEEAFRKGADYIVVGRPIRNAPDPREEAERFQRQIAAVLGEPAATP